MNKNKKTIGIFDSGVGGLSVVKQIIKHLPDYDLVYFGDTARVPYGSKGNETIKKYSLDDARFLWSKGAGIIMIGCNTASAVAYESIKDQFPVPIIDIIFPGVREALKVSKNKKIGIIATNATINSKAHENCLKRLDPVVSVYSKACPLLAPLAEHNSLSKKIVKSILKEYIEPLAKENIDTLILGCTHYPYFKKEIKNIFSKIKLIDPGEQAAKDVKSLLEYNECFDKKLSKKSKRKFYVSDTPQNFEGIYCKFLGRKPKSVEKVDIK